MASTFHFIYHPPRVKCVDNSLIGFISSNFRRKQNTPIEWTNNLSYSFSVLSTNSVSHMYYVHPGDRLLNNEFSLSFQMISEGKCRLRNHLISTTQLNGSTNQLKSV